MTTGRENPMSDLENHAKDYGVRLGVGIEFITISGESAFESVFRLKGDERRADT